MSAAVVTRVNGPVVEVSTKDSLAMLDLVYVGPQRLPGEVIALHGASATVQVYEYTGGLKPGDEVLGSGGPLVVRLGPGLLGGVFDGVLRPLGAAGARLAPGAAAAEVGTDRAWGFEPRVATGAVVGPGTILGCVQETAAIEHRVLVPAGGGGTVEWIAAPGEYGGEDVVARIGGRELGLWQPWPVRRPRPVTARLPSAGPLVTGQRVLDLLFPVARGGTAAIPGGFGTGKTVVLQQIAKWCDAAVIVYVGCGERGNEMADVLEELPKLVDPRSGRPLMDRTVIIANTSNMPVMAREASIYSGVTVAEYFRDMGYDAIVIADSTSRWAEALREFGSRTGQLPAEEGFPASLSSALAAFYERSGYVQTLSGARASVTVIGAVSPPGGDFTEPVTAHTRRFARTLWSLDRDLAYARHYPAVGWTDSFSRDAERLGSWHGAHGDPEWTVRRDRVLALLSESDRLRSMAELVGRSALPDRERVTLLIADLIRQAVLQQSALSPNDAYSTPPKQAALLDAVLQVHDKSMELVRANVPVSLIEELDMSPLVRAKDFGPPDDTAVAQAACMQLLHALETLR